MTVKPRIYLAGKIAKNDWRHEIVPGLRSAVFDHETLFDYSTQIDCGEYIYGGPFFVCCDHGCSHGPNSHGAGDQGCQESGETAVNLQSHIFMINRARLLRCNWVFAHIESTDCYGTLIELGMAHTEAIPIILTFAREIRAADRRDLWMAAQLTEGNIVTGSINHCWRNGLKRILNPL